MRGWKRGGDHQPWRARLRVEVRKLPAVVAAKHLVEGHNILDVMIHAKTRAVAAVPQMKRTMPSTIRGPPARLHFASLALGVCCGGPPTRRRAPPTPWQKSVQAPHPHTRTACTGVRARAHDSQRMRRTTQQPTAQTRTTRGRGGVGCSGVGSTLRPPRRQRLRQESSHRTAGAQPARAGDLRTWWRRGTALVCLPRRCLSSSVSVSSCVLAGLETDVPDSTMPRKITVAVMRANMPDPMLAPILPDMGFSILLAFCPMPPLVWPSP